MKKYLTLESLKKENSEFFSVVCTAINVYSDLCKQKKGVFTKEEEIQNLYFSLLYGFLSVDLLYDNVISLEEFAQIYGKESFCEQHLSCEPLTDEEIDTIYYETMRDFLYNTMLFYTGTEGVSDFSVEELLGLLIANLNDIGVVQKEREKLSKVAPSFVLEAFDWIKSFMLFEEDYDHFVEIEDDFFEEYSSKDSKNKGSVLEMLGEDLTAKEYSHFPAYARENELAKMEIQLLKQNDSFLLVGPAGCGKTALVEGLAYKIQKNLCRYGMLNNKKIIQIDVGSMVAGTTYRGEFEERVQKILTEAKKDPNIILFIDEIHTLIGAGTSSESSLDAANMLKTALSSSKIHIIGATTEREYQQYFASDSAFKRRLKKISVNPPKTEALLTILKSTLHHYMNDEIVMAELESFEDEMLNILIECTDSKNLKYREEQSNPSLAIGILDEAVARHKYNGDREFDLIHLMDAIKDCSILTSTARLKAAEALCTLFKKSREKTLKKILVA